MASGTGLLAAGHTPDATVIPPASASRHSPYWTRPDPYYSDSYWANPPVFSPRFKEIVDTDDETGAKIFRWVPDLVDPESERGIKDLTTLRNAQTKAIPRYVSVLNGFNHANTAQLVAWTGNSPTNRSKHFGPMFRLGLVERGRYAAGHKHVGKQVSLWKLHDARPIREYAQALPDETARRVFASKPGRPFPGGPHTRHDILTVEAILRMLETQPRWVGVSPEHASSPYNLTLDDTSPKGFSGDAALWRDDGLRVVLEVCASRNIEHHATKMQKWAEWLATRTVNDTGIVVVFLNAHKDRHVNLARAMRAAHSRVVKQGQLKLSTGQQPIASDIGVRNARAQLLLAAWEDWFPRHHAVSEAAQAARCAFTPDGKVWGRVDVADADAFPYAPTIRRAMPPDWFTTPPWAGNEPVVTPKAA